jgi:hypothetical protein
MEQLPITGSSRARRAVRAESPWPAAATDARPAVSSLAAAPSPTLLPPTLRGVERRLVRRAELLWDGLRPDAGLPDSAEVGPFLQPPFGRQALLYAADADAPQPGRILFVGADLAALGLAEPGPLLPTDRLSRRLAALAAAALAAGEPAHLDSDDCAIGASPSAPALLVRAVALPFAPLPDGARLALVLVSWRQLLSPAETEALQRELATAIEWMRDNLPSP